MTMQSRVGESGSLYRTLVKHVTQAIQARGMSLPNLSIDSGIAEERLTAIIEGHSKEVTLRELVGLSLALGVTLPALLGGS